MSGARGRVGWLARRLRTMSAAEVALHAWRAARYRADAAAWRVAPPVWKRRWEPERERIVAEGSRKPSLLFAPERIDAMRGVLESSEEGIVAEAERRLQGRVRLLGYPELTLGRNRSFDCDPLSGQPWPDPHGRLLDYGRSAPGDPKLTWELERCQELPLLALASVLTGESRFAAEAAYRARAWLTGHPAGRGIAWANTFEPALRAISLAVAFDALRGHPLLRGEAEDEVVRGLWQHGRWIVGGLSRYSSANNHLVAELVGLLAIALLVPELRDSSRWRALAVGELAREAELQILPDGSGAEQSFAYGLFTIDLLLAAAALLEAAGSTCPDPICAALARAADALTLLVDVDEPEPDFGDDDDGRVLLLDGELDRTAPGVAASLAAFLGHGGARRLAQSMDPTAAVLFGRRGVARFEAAREVPLPGDGVLPHGGLVVLRRAGARMLFDVGPLGYLSIAAHGHADALQVVLSRGGDELVGDPGTGSYLGEPALRRRLRGTAAHATLSVDGADQSEQGGPFLWVRHARARLVACDLDGGIAVGEHDGYLALPDPVAHQRAVVALDGGAVLVLDRVVGAQEHTYVQTWPLQPALVARTSDADARVVVASSGAGSGLMLALASSGESEILIADDGRWSRRLEQSEPACVVRQRASASGPVELGALLVPLAADAPPPVVALTLAREEGSCAVTSTVGDEQTILLLRLASGTPVIERVS